MGGVRGKTVAVGLSGGVDSAVAAALLKERGASVVGLFMSNWEEPGGGCPDGPDFEDAERSARALGVPCYRVGFAREYRERVLARFVRDYGRGLTPNPDVLCNSEIKFGVFLEKALGLGADLVAHGHHCRLRRDGGRVRLLRGRDPGKDQSYFLHAVKEAALARAVFPVGGLLKSEVRRLARERRLPVADKRDSTGICFVGKRDLGDFLEGWIPPRPGPITDLRGRTVGRHRGCARYTLGQRRGLGLGGPGEPWFVLGKDMAANRLVVGRGRDHPALYVEELAAGPAEWVGPGDRPARLPARLLARLRHGGALEPCSLLSLSGGTRVRFDRPQRAVAPGQSVVLYDGDVCLGGAVIESTGPTLLEQGRTLGGASPRRRGTPAPSPP